MYRRISAGLLALGLVVAIGCDGGARSSTSPAGTPSGGESDKKSRHEPEAAATPQELAEARGIVNRAIEAQVGSSERLEKLRNRISQRRGTLITASGGIEVTMEVQIAFPRSLSMKTKIASGDTKHTSTMTINGISGWQQAAGEQPEELGTQAAIESGNVMHAYWLASLIPFRDNSLAPVPLPELHEKDATLLGVKVKYRGRPDVSMYFDKKSGLLSKLSYRDLGVSGVVKEFWLADYKNFEGVKMPTSETEYLDGQKKVEWTISDYKFPEKLEAGAFERPKK